MKFMTRSIRRMALGLMALLLVGCSSAALSTGTASATTSRGFNGTTIKIGGLGLLSQFAGTDVGTEARIKRFNDTNEMPGIKIQFVGFSDDQGDPATALSSARQLVTQSGVFAIVPDMSPVNPVSYLSSRTCALHRMGYRCYVLQSQADDEAVGLWG